MMKAGAHLGYTKMRRHPSLKSFILTTKNKTDIIDLEKTLVSLDKTKEFMKKMAEEKKNIVFVCAKPEGKKSTRAAAEKINMPFVVERWIGGTLTNFPEIKKRIDLLIDLKDKRSKGELDKYTKKERLMFDREIIKLELYFGGLVSLKKIPDAIFIVDSKKEDITVKEANQMRIPVISLANTDSNIDNINYPIVTNDSSITSIKFFVDEIAGAYVAPTPVTTA